jgi:hypothetical protein
MRSSVALLPVFVFVVSCADSPAPPAAGTAATTAPVATAPARPPANPLREAYFGDLHLHTSYSMDAFAFGARTTPEDSYRYARGETVEYFGTPQSRRAPLDFLAVTDHAEYLGTVRESVNPNGPLAKTEWFTAMSSSDPNVAGESFKKLIGSATTNKPIPEFNDKALLTSAWRAYAAMADKYNQPGTFTTFVAFEWSSMPGGQNLHRCVVFKDRAPEIPFSAFDSQDAEALWSYLDAQRARGLEVVAVPHNGNVSNGLMFDTKDYAGRPLTADYARRRMANEPLVEIIQGKGQSETSPALSPTDEFADFEIFTSLLSGAGTANSATGSYVRQAYGVGQELREKLGVNPFKYGVEAGTDFHSGISSTEPDNYPGSHGNQDNDPRTVITATESVVGEPPITIGSGGLTGVWAEENTRDAIFAAFERKETFGTSGVRIKVRMFAGWRFPKDATREAGWVKTAYETGVAMGGDLVAPPAGAKPTFLVAALKDPNSANLDRVQIVKVSTRNGKSTERIYDVVWSGGRKLDARGTLPPVGNTVDVKTATYTNAIGAPELVGQWTDEDFDPAASATYYARVLEIPTPRWSTYWAAKLGLPPNPKAPASTQQRAWTSPIWYEASAGR